MKLRVRTASLWLVLLACSAGCLRWGYSERDRDRGRDAGQDAGGTGGRSGSGGKRGSGDSGTGGHAADGGGQAGVAGGGRGGSLTDAGSDAVDAGANRPGERDADSDDDDDDDSEDDGTDASVVDYCPERPGAIFCDGFEDPAFGRWSYSESMGGELARSIARKRTGEASLRAATGAAADGNEARYATTSLGRVKSGHLWLRYYYYVPASVVVTSHFSAGVMSEIQEPYAGFSLIVRPSRVDLSTMAGPVEGTVAFPRDRWVCVELHVKIAPTDGVFEAYLDGAVAVRSGSVNSVPADGFRTAEVGIHYAEAAQGPVEVFVDDVVIGSERMPCE